MADDRITKEEYLLNLTKKREDLEKKLGERQEINAKRQARHGTVHHTQLAREEELTNQIANVRAEIADITSTISDTEKSIGALLNKQVAQEKVLRTQKKGNADLSKDVNSQAQRSLKFLQQRTDKSGELVGLGQEQFETIQSVLSGTNDLEGINEQIVESKRKERDLQKQGSIFDAIGQQNVTELLEKEAAKLKFMEEQKAQMGLLDQITGGLASKAEGFIEAFQKSPKLAGYLILASIVASLIASANKFASLIDTVGQKFGSLKVLGGDVRDNLLSSTAEAKKLGGSIDDVVGITSNLSSEFGLSLDEASALSVKVFDTSKALGLSTDEASSLFGMLMQTSNLSAVQAEQLSEGAFQLARQAGVAPSTVLRDIAGSAEVFANFSKDGGDNLAEAAVQARQMGISLSTTAKIAEGLLDFETSVAAEVEASVLLGRQLNFQKARELALNNDIAGATKNIVDQLGSEAEFNNLNLIQRQALAKSIGVSTTELAKMVGQSDKLTLSGAMAASSFEDLLGEEGISTISRLMNSFKSLGVTLVNVLGPSLTMIAGALKLVLTPFEMLFGFLEKIGVLVPILTGAMTAYASTIIATGTAKAYAATKAILLGSAEGTLRTKTLASMAATIGSAIANAWKAGTAFATATLGFGTPGGIAIALGLIAGLGASLASAAGMIPSFDDLKVGQGAAVKGSPQNKAILQAQGGEMLIQRETLNMQQQQQSIDYGQIKNAMVGALSEGHLTSTIRGGDIVQTSERKLAGTLV